MGTAGGLVSPARSRPVPARLIAFSVEVDGGGAVTRSPFAGAPRRRVGFRSLLAPLRPGHLRRADSDGRANGARRHHHIPLPLLIFVHVDSACVMAMVLPVLRRDVDFDTAWCDGHVF